MQFVDTHTHLDDDAFSSDLEAVIERSRDQSVSRWINVGYNHLRWTSTIELANRINGVAMTLGLHPGDADDWNDTLEQTLVSLVKTHRPVAIGEIGLDLYWRQDNLSQQEAALRAQLGMACDLGLPAVIHMRKADTQLLAVLTSGIDLPKLHFHSFDGDVQLREWVVQNKATIGVGGLLTQKGCASLREWVASIPRCHVVLETDSPYLKPRDIRGKRNEPAFIPAVAGVLAELWCDSVAQVADQTTANAERIFDLPETSAS